MKLDLVTITSLIGVVMPALVSMVMRITWPSWVKQGVALLSSAIIGIGVAWLKGELDFTNIMAAIVTMAALSEATFRLYWRDTPIAALLERWWPWSKTPPDPMRLEDPKQPAP